MGTAPTLVAEQVQPASKLSHLIAAVKRCQFRDYKLGEKNVDGGLRSCPMLGGTTATLDAYEERVKLYVMSTKKDEKSLCGPRLLARFQPESDSFRIVREALTDVQLTAENGSGGLAIVAALRLQLGPKSMQQAVSLFLQLLKLNDIRRLNGESMKKWTCLL
mgnify:CR=1 FL=1